MGILSFAILALVAFVSALIQSATGFGFAIFAIPIFLVVLNSLAAVQIIAVANFALSIVLLPWLWRNVPKKPLFVLVAGSTIGFPIGLWLFLNSDVTIAKLVAGAIITFMAVFLGIREFRNRGNGDNDGTVFDFNNPITLSGLSIGVISGILGGALAMPGPAVMIYFISIRVAKAEARSITLTLFAYSYGVIVLLHTLWGGMNQSTWLQALQFIPFVFLGAWTGNIVSRKLSEDGFKIAVLLILAVSGFYAVWTAL
ncbi:MAG: sulfite exporter TauE/SafE family protein [Methyloligellaceae bacterium]